MSRRVRTGRRRVMLEAEPTFVRQVNDLTNTLYETDRNMSHNEELLSDFMEVARDQDDEISQVLCISFNWRVQRFTLQLREELDRSKQLLTEEKAKR